MGIRIHKKLCWAISDIKKDDPRVNWEVFRLCGKNGLDEFQNWIREQDRLFKPTRGGLNHLAYKMDDLLWVDDLFFYDVETFKNTILIGDGWVDHTRSDDGIDYVEDYLKRKNAKIPIKNSIQFLRDGYFPFQQFWMLAETWEHLRNVQRCNGEFFFGTKELNDRFGNLTQEDLDKMIVPEIPLVVKDICEYFKVFTDDKTKLQLRPALATYWR